MFCHKKLSWIYPLSEFLTGLMLVIAVYYSKILVAPGVKTVWDFIFLAVILCLFVVMLLSDAKYSLLPDSVSYLAIGSTVVFLLGGYAIDLFTLYKKFAVDPFGIYLIKTGYWNLRLKNSLWEIAYTLGSAIVIALFFYFLVKVTKGRGMGEGDIKLGLAIGLFNGFPNNFIAIFLGFLFGALYSLGLIILRKKTLKDHIPFGPFLILGSITSLLWGTNILNWYVHLF